MGDAIWNQGFGLCLARYLSRARSSSTVLTCTHTHTHTRARAHARTRSSTLTCIYSSFQPHNCTHKYTPAFNRTIAHTNTHAIEQLNTRTLLAHLPTTSLTQTHAPAHVCTLSHTQKHTHTHTHAQCKCARACMCVRAHVFRGKGI